MLPDRLKEGDEIRVISPARSLAIISQEVRKIAVDSLEGLGLKVSFSKNAEEKDEFWSRFWSHNTTNNFPYWWGSKNK